MDTTVLERVRGSLVEKRTTLAEWLRTTPPRRKSTRLGPAAEGAVQRELDVLDETLEKVEDGTLGICEICQGEIETELLEMDYTASFCLADLSADERRLLESDLELSQMVQRALLPQRAPSIPGLELAAFSRPAQIVGGDYFDFLRFGDGSHGLAIADVAGKGMSASLLMASLQTLLRALAPEAESPAAVVERLNRLFCHNIRFTTFVTLFLGRIDPATGRLEYCNAGHNPPLLFRSRAGEAPLAWLHPTGPAVGLIEDAAFEAGVARLAPGDLLLLYTDGVTEACDRQKREFGYDRLAGFVQERGGASAGDLIRDLRRALEAYCEGEPLQDDTTIVACRVA